MVEITISLEFDIPYTSKDDQLQSANLVYPGNQESRSPAVILVHSNGLYGSELKDKSDLFEVAKVLAWRGIFSMIINFDSGSEALGNCKCAVRFLKAHADQYHINPNRIGIWGFAHGGHLASLVGTSARSTMENIGGWDDNKSSVHAVCDWFGPTDLSRLQENHTDSLIKYLGSPAKEGNKNVENTNPITHLAGSTPPPFLIVHRADDQVIPFEQSQLLFDALKTANADVEMIVISGENQQTSLLDPSSEIFNKSIAFFEKKLIN